MTPYETFTHNGFTIEIHQDSDAQSPEEWGNEDLFLVTTRNRSFEVTRKGFDIDSIREHKRQYHILPLFAYVHSGVALSLGRGGQFSDPWDSGQIGFVLVKKGQGFRNIRKAAESLVEEWNMYLSGDVWGFEIKDSAGGLVDSCWGHYGIDYCKETAMDSCPRGDASYALRTISEQPADCPL